MIHHRKYIMDSASVRSMDKMYHLFYKLRQKHYEEWNALQMSKITVNVLDSNDPELAHVNLFVLPLVVEGNKNISDALVKNEIYSSILLQILSTMRNLLKSRNLTQTEMIMFNNIYETLVK